MRGLRSAKSFGLLCPYFQKKARPRQPPRTRSKSLGQVVEMSPETPNQSRSPRQPPYRLNRRNGRCPECGRSFDPWGTCKRKSCPGYQSLWIRDCCEVVRGSFAAYEGDHVAVLSLTAPGARQLPWDLAACRVHNPHRCRGSLGCRVQRDCAIAFNRTASERGRDLHREARRLAKKSSGRPVELLGKFWELQQRGVVHGHLVLGFADEDENAVRTYAKILHRIAPDFDFGFTQSRLSIVTPNAAAAYCSKALSKTVAEYSAPGRIHWIAPRLQRASGRSMRGERRKRAEWWQGQAAGADRSRSEGTNPSQASVRPDGLQRRRS